MKRVLVTGGRGILGKALIPQLMEAGFDVHATSRKSATTADNEVTWHQLNLTADAGIAKALSDVDIIIHAASSVTSKTKQTDVEGTARLLRQAEEAGVSHFIYISIVGIDRIPLGYYKNKLAAEALITQSNVPWSILRATQFHTLLDMACSGVSRLPIIPAPTDFQFQLIDPTEVAQRLVEVAESNPGGQLPDIGGAEILTAGDIFSAWLTARGIGKRIIHVPLPGAIADGYRRGYNTAPAGRYGQIRWQDWLEKTYQPSIEETLA